MKVYLNDRMFVKSDSVQFLLVEEKTVQEGKTKGTVNEFVIGYYGEIEHVLQAFVKQMQLESKATTIHELLQETKDLREYVKNLVEGYDV
jgi:hypothetical protein